MQVNRKGIEIRQPFSLEMVFNIQQMGFAIPKTVSDCETCNILCLQASDLAPKWVTGDQHGNSLVVRRVSPDEAIKEEQNMLFLVKLNPELSS